MERLQEALAIAREVPAPVDRADALDWVERELAQPGPRRVATVVFHSIFIQYLTPEERARLVAFIEAAGEERATPDAPLAWLRMEPGDGEAEIRLTLWPGGEEELVATSGVHGAPVVLR